MEVLNGSSKRKENEVWLTVFGVCCDATLRLGGKEGFM